MSVPTAEPTAPRFGADQRPSGALPPLLGGWRTYGWMMAIALAIGALSLLYPSTPSYDPWSWLVWGREILHGTLHTQGGPTWKPLPIIFATVFAIFGSAQPNLWLVVARAGAVLATLMTFKLAARLTWWLRGELVERALDASRGAVGTIEEWAPAALAGLVAAAGLAFSGGLLSDSALGYSEALATAALLIGVERHLDGHHRQAFALGFVAALARPEIWLFWGPYGLWLMWKDPESRTFVIGLAILCLILWFVPQKWGGGSWLSGFQRAQHPRKNSPAFAACPFCTELSDHAWRLVLLRVKVAAILVLGFAAVILGRAIRSRRSLRLEGARERALAALAVSGAFGYGWWILIALETQAGFSGNDRYLVIGSGFIDICGGAGFGWAAFELARFVRRRLAGRGASRAAGGLAFPAASGRTGPAALAGAALFALIFVFLPNWVGGNTIDLSRTHRSLNYQATLRSNLVSLIDQAGGIKKLEACGAGHVMSEGFQVPMVSWYFSARISDIEAQPATDANGVSEPYDYPWPNVIFQDRDTRHAELLPEWATIHAWERQGAHYIVRDAKEIRFFEDCSPQPHDRVPDLPTKFSI